MKGQTAALMGCATSFLLRGCVEHRSAPAQFSKPGPQHFKPLLQGIQSFKDLSRKEPYWGPPLYNSATTLQYFILHLYLTYVQRDSTKPKISGKWYFYSSTDETRSLTVMETLLSSASPLTVFWAATKDKQVRDGRRKPAPNQGRTPVPVGLQQPARGLLEALQQDRKACDTGDLVSNVTCSSWAAITTL